MHNNYNNTEVIKILHHFTVVLNTVFIYHYNFINSIILRCVLRTTAMRCCNGFLYLFKSLIFITIIIQCTVITVDCK
jgi:hypothetical protein